MFFHNHILKEAGNKYYVYFSTIIFKKQAMESGRPSARCSDKAPSETQGSSLGGTFLRGNDKPGLLRSQAGDEPQEERLRNLGVQS